MWVWYLRNPNDIQETQINAFSLTVNNRSHQTEHTKNAAI